MCSRKAIGLVLVSYIFGGCGRKKQSTGEVKGFKEINLVKRGEQK